MTGALPPPVCPKGPHWIVMRMSPGPRQLGRTYYRHATEEAAIAEATRLAALKPGHRFSVYSAGPSIKIEAAA